MKAIAVILVLLGCVLRSSASVTAGQDSDSPIKIHVPKPVATSRDPVTLSEARATFIRAEAVLRRGLNLVGGPTGVLIPTGSAPVRRGQIVSEMSRLYVVVLPRMKITPRAVKFDPSVFSISDPKQRANLTRLVRLGAIARIGPLATNRTDTLTVAQFGDAVGFFLARMAELTHQPSGKWTPWLRDKGQ